MHLQTLHLDLVDKLAWITLARPEKRNALNAQMLEELDRLLDHLEAHTKAGVLVLTGEGDQAFAAGADLTELQGLDPEGARRLSRQGQRVLGRLEAFPKPVLAAVQGWALGGGLELALACHLRVAGEGARFGCPEVGLGFPPGYGATQRLPRLVGRGAALELLLTGESIGAEEALALGLVNRVFPDADLRAGAEKLARTLLTRAPLALRAVLEAVHAAPGEGSHLEASLFGVAAGTRDYHEGLAAFLEKRKPSFKGC